MRQNIQNTKIRVGVVIAAVFSVLFASAFCTWRVNMGQER